MWASNLGVLNCFKLSAENRNKITSITRGQKKIPFHIKGIFVRDSCIIISRIYTVTDMHEGTPMMTIQRTSDASSMHDYFPFLKMLSQRNGRLVVLCILNIVVVLNIPLLFCWLTVRFHKSDDETQGFSIDTSTAQFFNLHKMFMVMGLCILPPNALLIYRYRIIKFKRILIKIAHALILLTSILCAAAGLGIVIKYNIDKKSDHFTSIHSWFGLTTIVFFVLQWLIGLFVFLVPTGVSLRYKEAILMFHRFTGLMLVILPTLTAIMGIEEVNGFGVEGLSLLAKFLTLGLFVQAALVILFLYGPGSLILTSAKGSVNENR